MAKSRQSPENPQLEPAQPPSDPAAVWLDIDTLVPWADNPKKPTRAEIAEVAESITRFGFGSPMVARKANLEIIAGHTRWQGAKKAGLKFVAVRLLDLSEYDAHVLALADNELGADWDPDMLKTQLEKLAAEERQLAGWSEKEFASLYGKGKGAAPEEQDLLGGNGFEHSSKFGVIVMVANEQDQERVFNELTAMGHTCKVVCV